MQNIIKLLSAVFLISGTAIGAGLVALPIVAANLSMHLIILIIVIMAFIAYQTSMMTIDLNEMNKKAASIVELSKQSPITRIISLLSFYTLSLALLTVYVYAFADTLRAFLNINGNFLMVICGVILFVALNLKMSLFQKVNSVLVLMLLIIISTSALRIYISSEAFDFIFHETEMNLPEVTAFLPIIFTSFGVQNICPNVYEYLEGNRKKINLAFMIGIIIPAIVYGVWIYCVFKNIMTRDVLFFEKLQNYQVSAGELIKFLCNSSNEICMEILFKVLSLFAIITSAIGTGVGLLKSFREINVKFHNKRILAIVVICFVPVLFGILVPNAFINILSFGEMIATIFVIGSMVD